MNYATHWIPTLVGTGVLALVGVALVFIQIYRDRRHDKNSHPRP